MEPWLVIFLPFFLLMARTAAFLSICPVFGSPVVPSVAKVGLVFWVSVFFAVLVPPPFHAAFVPWMQACMWTVQEVLVGLAMGLAARLIFLGVNQAGVIISQQMGMTDSGVIDPLSGEESDCIATLLEMAVTLAFLAAGGHRLLIAMLGRTYKVFPLGGSPDVSALANGIVAAGAAMLLLALKIAGPLLAAFLVLAIVLAILARALPELNILFESYPLRVALGLFMMIAIMPLLNSFVEEITGWMNSFF